MNYIDNIDIITKANTNYRQVIHTTKEQQLVVMSIPYNIDIGVEAHESTTQFIKIESGRGQVIMNNKTHDIKRGDCLMIAPKTRHNIISKSKNGLKLYTIYSPPEHKKNLIQKTKP